MKLSEQELRKFAAQVKPGGTIFYNRKELPPDFIRTARNDVSEIQALQHSSLPLFGVQFHPELFDEDHPHGRQILENFLKL